MQGLKIQLPSEVTDSTLPKLGEYRISLIGCGDLSSFTKFNVYMLREGAKISVVGGFFSSGVTPANIGTAFSSTKGWNIFNVVATQKNAYIAIEDISAIERFGSRASSTLFAACHSPVDSPIPIIDLDNLPRGLVSLYNNWGALRGSVRGLTNCKNLVSFCSQKTRDNIQLTWLNTNPALEEEWVTGVLGDYGTSEWIATPIWPDLQEFLLQTRGDCRISTSALSNLSLLDTFEFVGETFGERICDLRMTGDIWDIRTTPIKTLIIAGDGMLDGIGGNMSVFKDNIPSLTTINLQKNTKIIGSMSNLPAGIVNAHFNINTNIVGYTARAYTGTLNNFVFPVATQSTAVLDAILIDLAKANWVGSSKIILRGARSSASDASVATLKAKGVSVYINQVLQ